MAQTTIAERQVGGFAGWFTTRPLWYLTGAAILVNALLFGIGPGPYYRYAVEMMSDPFNIKSIPEIDQFNVEPGSPLGWMLAHLLGIDSFNGLVILHLALIIASVLVSAYMVAAWVSDFAGRLFITAWFASPLASTNLTWLGKPDHFTLVATVMLACGPAWACAGGGFVLGFNHFEQGLLILAGTFLVRRYITGDKSWRWTAHMLAGFAAGRLLWTVYASSVNYDASRRFDWVLRDLEGFVRVWRGDLPTLIFGAFGVSWVAVIVMWRNVDRSRRWILAGSFGLATAATLVTLDTTRVYTLVTLPILLGCVFWHDRNTDHQLIGRVMPWFVLAAVFVPRVMLYGAGAPYVSSWERLT